MTDGPNPYEAPRAEPPSLETSPAPRTLWKIYAFAVLVLQVVGLAVSVPEMDATHALDYVMTTVGVVGLFGFAFRRRVLVRGLWMVWSFLLPAWDVAMGLWVYPSQQVKAQPGWITAYFMAMVLFLPEYLALLLYAYRSRELWRR